jgi:hypothetical protein
MLYRLGELAPAGPLAAAAASDTPRISQVNTGSRGQPPSRRKGVRRAVDVRDLVTVGRVVADELAGEGVPLTRAALAERLRARGASVSNARMSALLAELRTAAPGVKEG